MEPAERSIVVRAPVAAVYKRWLVFEDYPKFISVIKQVRKLDATHFVASIATGGKQHEAMMEIVLRVPERRLAWRIVSNCAAPEHLAAGVLSFASFPGRATCITLKLTSGFGVAISERVGRYLENFKTMIERERETAKPVHL
jgi:uncharacterized membrane protein